MPKKFPRLTAAFIGSLGSLLILSGVEGALRFSEYKKRRSIPMRLEDGRRGFIRDAESRMVLYQTDDYVQQDADLGFVNAPSFKTHATLKREDKIIYDVTYETDSFGRRVTPQEGLDKRKEFLVFAGCSFTFGEGVGQNQTLPYYASLLLTGHHVYNYGVGGYNPSATLAQFQGLDLKQQIKGKKGIFIFTFIDYHVQRSLGTMKAVSTSWANTPYFYDDADGNIFRKGSFTTGRPFTTFLYRLFGSLAITQRLNFDIPFEITDRHFHFAAQLLNEIKKNFLNQFPGQDFYVLFYPGSQSGRIIPYLMEFKIKYFDYSHLQKYNILDYRIPYDNHPSAKAHKAMAELLKQDLHETLVHH